jgi:hypothetical protein
MNKPASASPSAASRVAGSTHSPGAPWFRSRDGRRYGIEIGLVIVVKLALLVLLCAVLVYVWPRADTPPASVIQRYYAPPAPAAAS